VGDLLVMPPGGAHELVRCHPKGHALCSRRRWHAGVGLDGDVDERHCARCLLPPFHFGEPAGDMGMLRIKRACLVKGGNRFGKLPRHQARVPVRKGVAH
jgi:hypothetical protein